MPQTSTASPTISAPSRSSFRPELQGLRALAVGLVLLFHLWPGRIPGGFVGVDVFFVISGFLITGHLYKELTTTGTIKVTKFWARRVMRLLPLAFTVLIFSVLALIFLLPETSWGMNVRQIISSLFYIENWILAVDSVDYMAAENQPSLVQHYWSLSIEEQFYFALPIIVLSAYALSKFAHRSKAQPFTTRTILVVTLGFVAVISFIVSIIYTSYDPAQAYFITPTRLWEFAIGGLIALIANSSTLPEPTQNIVGWGGIMMILLSALFYSEATAFPGYAALLPVIGSVLFIRYGAHTERSGVYWLASRNSFVRMGDWSYAIYLWHWPLIIIATYMLDEFKWPHKIGIIVLTFVLAAFSQRLIEDPLRHAKYFKVPVRTFTAMAATIALIAAGTSVLPRVYASDYTDRVSLSDCTGANAILTGCSDPGLEGEPLIPPAQVAGEKSEQPYPECFIPKGKTDFDRSGCSLGAAPEDSELTIAIFGSSHARMWLPMLDEVGKHHNWNIQGYTKSACSPVPLSKTRPEDSGAEREDNQACDNFVLETAEEISNDPNIDVVATASFDTGTYFKPDGEIASDQNKIEAIDAMWQEWIDSGKSVVTFAEVPYFDNAAPECIEANPSSVAEACSTSYEDGITSREVFQRITAEEGHSDIKLYDPARGMCDSDSCYSMVGNLITRYDKHHLSQAFVLSYETDFAKFLQEEVVK